MGTTQIDAGLVIQLNQAGDGTTALAMRRAIGLLLQQSAPGVVIPGRLGATHLVVTGRTDMGYNVSAGGAVLTRSSQGAYIVPVHQAKTVATDAMSGVNPRWDRLYIHQPDPGQDGETVDVRAVIGVAVGEAQASPVLPTIPEGALELARALLPAGATKTDAVTFTNVAAIVGLNVGVVGISNGGHGATTVPGARTALGITSGTADPNNANGADGDIYLKIIP